MSSSPQTSSHDSSQQQDPHPGNRETQEKDVFRRFDVVSDPSDHFYVIRSKGNNCNAKQIMKEWKILEENLPDTIYVRVYENRIDIMRAAIVGVAGTPYHDGLFFFDIAFPSDYPARPPRVYYRSFGMRINPNLYANGRVCLSLLNTWAGDGSENWVPGESTMLQVLLSIQALVLNEKPYLNDLGAAVWPGFFWEGASRAYNDNVFVLNCKTMLFLVRRAPKNFEGFVAKHFRDRARVILSACDAYKDGRARVGYYTNNDKNQGSTSSSSLVYVSKSFKEEMTALFLRLLEAFSECGASLENFVEELKAERGSVGSSNPQVGIFKRVWRMLTEL